MSKEVAKAVSPVKLDGGRPVKRLSFATTTQVVHGVSMSGWTSERNQGLTVTYYPAEGAVHFMTEGSDSIVAVPFVNFKNVVI